MAEHRVVVEVDFAIEREELVILGGDEGIDLHQRGVSLDICLVETGHEFDGFVDLRGLEAELECEIARLVGLKADHGIDVFLVDRIGIFCGNFFDLHAAGLRGHEDELRFGAIEDDAEVELAVDRARSLR